MARTVHAQKPATPAVQVTRAVTAHADAMAARRPRGPGPVAATAALPAPATPQATRKPHSIRNAARPLRAPPPKGACNREPDDSDEQHLWAQVAGGADDRQRSLPPKAQRRSDASRYVVRPGTKMRPAE